MNKGLKTFDSYQRRVLGTCFIVYFCAYIGRLNMSATLREIIGEFEGLDKATAGLLATVFAVSYAAGQLVFGFMADRFEPRRLIMTGLIGSACANMLFSFMPVFALMVGAWTLNGIFQSMIWTPIVIFMAHTFEPSQRTSASFVMSFTLALGHLAAWALAMYLNKLFSWRWSYRIPALVLLAAALAAFRLLPAGLRGQKREGMSATAEAKPVSALLGTGLIFMLLCCILNGFVRDGVVNWGPTILGGSKDSILFTLVIPCVNLFGILLGSYLVRHYRGNIRALVGLMTGFTALPAFLAFAGGAAYLALSALLLGLMSALLYGTNPLLTTFTPLQYNRFGRVGLVAGLIDCSIYLGSALSGTVTGMLSETAMGWHAVFLIWGCAALASCLFAQIASVKGKMLASEK